MACNIGRLIVSEDIQFEFDLNAEIAGEDIFSKAVDALTITDSKCFWIYRERNGIRHWLDKKERLATLRSSFPRGRSVALYFGVRYFPDLDYYLQDAKLTYLLYLHLRNDLYKGFLVLDAVHEDQPLFIEIAAYSLIASNGPYVSDRASKDAIFSSPFIVRHLISPFKHQNLLNHAPLEKIIIDRHKSMGSITVGEAIRSFVVSMQKTAVYGLHMYHLKDSCGRLVDVGVGFKGISVFSKRDFSAPKMHFQWKELENIYYKDRKFTVEVCSPARTSVNLLHVHSWLTHSTSQAHTLWIMAVAQHQNFLKCRQHRNTGSVSSRCRQLSSSCWTQIDKSIEDLITSKSLLKPACKTLGSGELESSGGMMKTKHCSSFVERLQECEVGDGDKVAKEARRLPNCMKAKISLLHRILELRQAQLDQISGYEEELSVFKNKSNAKVKSKVVTKDRCQRLIEEINMSQDEGNTRLLELQMSSQQAVVDSSKRLLAEKTLSKDLLKIYFQIHIRAIDLLTSLVKKTKLSPMLCPKTSTKYQPPSNNQQQQQRVDPSHLRSFKVNHQHHHDFNRCRASSSSRVIFDSKCRLADFSHGIQLKKTMSYRWNKEQDVNTLKSYRVHSVKPTTTTTTRCRLRPADTRTTAGTSGSFFGIWPRWGSVDRRSCQKQHPQQQQQPVAASDDVVIQHKQYNEDVRQLQERISALALTLLSSDEQTTLV